MAGTLIDPSFALVTSDNTARVAYVENAIDVRYARVGLDNALLVGAPIPLTVLPASQGVLPLPRLRLDSLNRSHIAWAANNNGGTASGVYYALVKQASTGVDNLAIGATQVLPGDTGGDSPTCSWRPTAGSSSSQPTSRSGQPMAEASPGRSAYPC